MILYLSYYFLIFMYSVKFWHNNLLYFNGASNINIYYSNSNMKPNIYTNTITSNVSNQLTLEANDGKNYY